MCRVALIPLLATATLVAQQPEFSARTELVRLDVLVERGGRPVSGLTASDFIVEDAGIPQRVELLRAVESVTVSTVLDVSGSISNEQLRKAAAAVRSLTIGLRKDDRHRLYAFAGDTREIAPAGTRESMTIEDVSRALRSRGGPHTSLFDALYTAILRGDDDDEPKLAVVLTDGHNNTSWLDAQSVIDAAARHDTVIYVVALRGVSSSHPVNVPPAAADAGLIVAQALAERTGGRVFHAEWSGDLGAVFDSILQEYRQRFILYFVPKGVSRGDGWHPLNVKLPRHQGKVHARKGYWSN